MKVSKFVHGLISYFEFPSIRIGYLWCILALFFIPLTTFIRFYFLSNALIEPHPIRQTQTALTIYYFAKGEISFFKYHSPMNGQLWNFIVECPIYEWLAARLVLSGLSLEVASRLVTLFFFFVGVLSLFWLISKFFGKHIAAWSSLFYIIAPFNVIFSRTCLIDFTALGFLLLSFSFLYSFFKKSQAHFFLLGLSCIFGCLSALTKVTVWFSPILFIFMLISYFLVKKKIPKAKGLSILFSCLFQLFVAMAWIRWSIYVRGGSSLLLTEGSTSWIIGDLALRFHFSSWLIIGKIVFRWILHDWLLLIFIIALFWPGNYLKESLILFIVSLFSILVTFNVHCAHDYYFIGEVPYIFTLSGIGMARIFNIKNISKYIILFFILIILLYRTFHLQYVYGPVFHNYYKELSIPLNIKSLSTKKDLIYASGHSEEWAIPLYSERLVVLAPYYRSDSLSPSLFWFDKPEEQLHILSNQPNIWIDGTNFLVYRVKENKPFVFSAEKHIGVFNNSPNGTHATNLTFDKEINSCNFPKTFFIPETVLPEHKKLFIKINGKYIFLPRKKFISLPNLHNWGCKFVVSAIK